MNRVCRKCSIVNDAATGEPLEACPSCGAIYDRVESSVLRQTAGNRRVFHAAGKSNLAGPTVTLLGVSWFVTILSTSAGSYMLWLAMQAEAAPAQGAAAAVACGMAIIPYVFTRALEGLMRKRAEQ